MFDAPRGLVLTTRQVMYEGWPILTITHDAEGPRWQFVNGWGDTDDQANAIWVHPEHLVALDGSIAQLADLPPDWQAWRQTPDEAWTRAPQPPANELVADSH